MEKTIGIAAGLVIAFMLGMFVHIDFYPGLDTYGWSAGTNYHYCSVELAHGIPSVGCESAQ